MILLMIQVLVIVLVQRILPIRIVVHWEVLKMFGDEIEKKEVFHKEVL